MPLGTEVGLGADDIVLDGDPLPLPKKGALSSVYCGQTAGWIKMALGTEVGLGSGHIVLVGTQLPSQKKPAEAPHFLPIFMWPNDWIHQDATWYGSKPQPRQLCVK